MASTKIHPRLQIFLRQVAALASHLHRQMDPLLLLKTVSCFQTAKEEMIGKSFEIKNNLNQILIQLILQN